MTNLRFYLDSSLCGTLCILYYGEPDKPVMVNIGEIITLRNEWDDHHRSVMAAFVRVGRFVMKLQPIGYGWFEVLNYPSFLNPAEGIEEIQGHAEKKKK